MLRGAFLSDDPIADWDAYCDAEERELKKYPKCCKCGEHITDTAYDIYGEIYCYDCLLDEFEVDAEKLKESDEYDV